MLEEGLVLEGLLMLLIRTTMEVEVDSKVAVVMALEVNRVVKSTFTFLLGMSGVQTAVKVLMVAVHPTFELIVFSADRVNVM